MRSPHRVYRSALRIRAFRRLWIGYTVSALGDSMSWVALVWLLYQATHSARDLGWLVVAYTAPVVVGGLLVGRLLDRFDKAAVMRLDSLARGSIFMFIPALAYLHHLQRWHVFAVATVYGLLKMVPLAGFPGLLAALVPTEALNTANSLESIGFQAAVIAGPALAGISIAAVGAPAVVALDALTYFVFAALLIGVAEPSPSSAETAPRGSLRAAAALIWRRRPLLATTALFMCANVGEGILLVALPIYTSSVLRGEASLYGLMVASLSVGGLLGAVVAGMLGSRWTSVPGIAIIQVGAGVALLPLALLPGVRLAAGLLLVCGALTGLMTPLGQSLRMAYIPSGLRGTTFAVLRTAMQATPPAGGLLAASLLLGPGMRWAVASAALLVGAPPLMVLTVGARSTGRPDLP